MSGYLSEIEDIAESRSRSSPANPKRKVKGTKVSRVRIMQSNGGILSATAAAREPVRTILSGPAGGVLGAQFVAEAAGFERIITFDMGGTSTDVALMDAGAGESLATTSESVVSGMPVAVPMLDIHTVGAGGGSIARFDRAGALRVGPESAGADPGPICYGRGEKATVTDANLILGRIPESGLLGGAFKLELPRARRYMHGARGPMHSAEALRRGHRGRGQLRDGESHTRHLRGTRSRSARLHARGVWRRGRVARLRTRVVARNSSRARPVFSGSSFRAGHSARRRDKGFIAHGSAGSSKLPHLPCQNF